MFIFIGLLFIILVVLLIYIFNQNRKLCRKLKILDLENYRLKLQLEHVLNKNESKPTGTQKLLEFQKELRENATQAEKIFYKYLEDHRVKFEFQKILCPDKCYIVDFFLNDYNVIVEIDGGYHDTKEQQEKDWQRSLEIYKHFGYKTFRLKNSQLIHNHFEEKLINFLRKNASKQRSS